MNEFELINQFFTAKNYSSEVITGVGDDCARLKFDKHHDLIVTTDTLVSGIHFFADDPAASVAHKSLTCSLSDIASQGGQPKWVLINLTVPKVDVDWVTDFHNGINKLLTTHNGQLIGGDLSKGPLAVTVTIIGQCAVQTRMQRNQAKIGDGLYLTGDLGLPAAFVAMKFGQQDSANKYHYPTARVKEGLAIAKFANAAIDISDGLLADLAHITEKSNCGITINYPKLPIAKSLLADDYLDQQLIKQWVLVGGDEYELCWTMPIAAEQKLSKHWPANGSQWCKIGTIEQSPGIRLVDAEHQPLVLPDKLGWQHFD